MKLIFMLGLKLLLCSTTEAAKVLVLFPMASPSHNILGSTLAKGLANSGLDITYVSPYIVNDAPENMKSIQLDGLAEWFQGRNKKEVDLFSFEHNHPIFNLLMLNGLGLGLTEKFFNHSQVQKLLISNEQFDAVILEQFWNDAMQIFGHHFKAPMIIYSTVEANKWVNGFVGNPEPFSYTSDILLSFDISNANLWSRMHNLVFHLICQANFDFYFYPAQNKLLKKYYPDGPNIRELQQNVSFLILNSHESINKALPHVPNMIDIGGYHVSPPKQLPADLQSFMDNATEGVIYFSMGSILDPSRIPQRTNETILKLLSSRKEKVLWKSNEKNWENLPPNFKVSKWFPQQDVLAHPKCKLFITHGGILSITEAVYHGVPLLVFPIFGDQHSNAARAQALGIGKYLKFSKMNEESLREVIDELLDNPRYRENAKYRSKIMHDRPVPPMDMAIYWVNYVIRHKGALHLRVPGADLPFYGYYLLDVLAALIVILLAISYVLYRTVKLFTVKKSIRKMKEN